MTLTQIFRGYLPGDPCTGAVHRFNLQAPNLVRRGVIVDRGSEYAFVSLTPEADARRKAKESPVWGDE